MINAKNLKNLLEEAYKDTSFQVETKDEKHFTIKAESNLFKGLSTLERQKLIFRVIGPLISKGTIHAVELILKTEEETHG